MLQEHMGHGNMSNCVEETVAGKDGKVASLVGNEGKTTSSTVGNGQMQMQANGVIVAIKANGSNGSSVENNGSGAIASGKDCTNPCPSNGKDYQNNGSATQVEVGVKSVPSLQGGSAVPRSNGVKSVSALLDGMQLSYQAKAVGAVLTGKVTYIEK